MVWLRNVLIRLKKPSVLLSLISQITSILLLLGFDVDSQYILSVATVMCSIFVTLGILSNPDTVNKGYGDDVLLCSKEHKFSAHTKINGEMVCTECGCSYSKHGKK